MTGGTWPRLSGSGICDRRLWYALGARRSQLSDGHPDADTAHGPCGRPRKGHVPIRLPPSRVPCSTHLLSHSSRCVPAPGFSQGLARFVSLTPHVPHGQTQAPALTLALFHFLLLERLIWKLGAVTLCCGAP